MIIPASAERDVQQAFHDVYDRLDSLLKGNIDLRGRRITNAGRSVGQFDYVTRFELQRGQPERIERQIEKTTTLTPSRDDAEPGSGLLARLDGTQSFTGARNIIGLWAFSPLGQTVPFSTSKTGLVTNLNADMLDDAHAETGSGQMARLDGTGTFSGSRSITGVWTFQRADSTVYSATAIPADQLLGLRNINNGGVNNTFAMLRFLSSSNNGSHNSIAAISLITPNSGSHSSRLAFQLRNAAGSYLEVMRLYDTDIVEVLGTAKINGAFDHDGSTAGVFGVTPAARAAAYTQTFAAATRAHAARTADAITDNTLGTASTTIGDTPADYNEIYFADALASLIKELNDLRTDQQNTAQVLNQVIDDLQLYGWLQ